ncbi:transposase [Streptomyces althioticus]|uniref:transposase n=1 Tax=Streptomyces althioticus TaxID=83380 RepID=UPI0036B06CAE
MGGRDFIALADGVHQLLKAPIVLVWHRLNTDVSHARRELVAERDRLRVFLPSAYLPDFNPVEWVWQTSSAARRTSSSEPTRNPCTLTAPGLCTIDGFQAGTAWPSTNRPRSDEPSQS